MFFFLDLVNHYLGYFTTESKLKGRIYTAVAAVGVWYVLWLSYQLHQAGHWLRSLALLGLFCVLLYFTILNIIFYFTKKTVRWDITPRIERLFGRREAPDTPSASSSPLAQPAHGYYKKEQVLPATLTMSSEQRQAVAQLAAELADSGLLRRDYGGLADAEQQAIVRENGQIAANHPGTVIPYVAITAVGERVQLVGGVNQLVAKPLATLTTIGMTPALEAQQRYQLAPATVLLHGGPGRQQGRQQLTATTLPWRITAEIAYHPR